MNCLKMRAVLRRPLIFYEEVIFVRLVLRDGLIKALNEEYNGTAEQFERAVDETVLKLRQIGAVIDE